MWGLDIALMGYYTYVWLILFIPYPWIQGEHAKRKILTS
jgi:hypothetical protein